MLDAIRLSQPEKAALPDVDVFKKAEPSVREKFSAVLEVIGGKAVMISSLDEIALYVKEHFADARRIVSTLPELEAIYAVNSNGDPHMLEDIDLAVLTAHFGVAENGAVWLTEDLMVERVLPFICQYLAVVLNEEDIVPSMHEAYERIGNADYDFGTFIAGPSKTADIEQSLVLGAHGARGMTVFIKRRM